MQPGVGGNDSDRGVRVLNDVAQVLELPSHHVVAADHLPESVLVDESQEPGRIPSEQYPVSRQSRDHSVLDLVGRYDRDLAQNGAGVLPGLQKAGDEAQLEVHDLGCARFEFDERALVGRHLPALPPAACAGSDLGGEFQQLSAALSGHAVEREHRRDVFDLGAALAELDAADLARREAEALGDLVGREAGRGP